MNSDSDQSVRVKIPSLHDLFIQFFLIGAISFGGGIVAYERILLVDKRRWLTADEFMAYLAISQTMPGLNAVNLAVLSGDKLRGAIGSICAVIGLLLPGGLFVLAIGILLDSADSHPIAGLILGGIAAAATGLLAAITYKIGGDQWRHVPSVCIMIATFLLMSITKLSLPWVLLIMAPIALFIYRPKADKK